ncbi:MAG: DNA polymerase III subunit delta [Nitriliruptorales bacterium]
MPVRAPVYLVTGDDELLLQRALERLLTEVRAAEPQLDVAVVDTGDVAELPELRTASLFGGVRCVVVRGAENLSGSLAAQVGSYLDAPDLSSTLVLVARGTARIRTIAQRAATLGQRIEVAAPKPWATREWAALAASELRRLGRSADPSAIQALFDHAGTDAATLASKCSQVAAATPEGACVTAGDVERVVEGHGNRGSFAVADAVAERAPADALIVLRGAIEAGEAPLAVLGAIVFRLRQLLQIAAGASSKDLGVSPGQHRRLQALAGRFEPGELAWCQDRAARADLDLKGSDLPSDLLLELAVLELATGAAAP